MPIDRYSFKEEFSQIIKELKQDFVKIKQEYQETSKKSTSRWTEAKVFFRALVGITPPKGSPVYVEGLFDSYADNFENSLLENLLYQSPKVICEMLHQADSRAVFAKVIDLACGTGLMAEALKEKFTINHIEGTDISAKMLVKAQAKNIYNHLYKDDLLSFFDKNKPVDINLITMSDALVYLGDVTELFSSISKALAKGGFFAFDFELLEKEIKKDFFLRKTARFAYNQDYIMKKLKDVNLLPIINKEDIIRYEYGKPIIGGFIVATKR